jgi:hypothetical protein
MLHSIRSLHLFLAAGAAATALAAPAAAQSLNPPDVNPTGVSGWAYPTAHSQVLSGSFNAQAVRLQVMGGTCLGGSWHSDMLMELTPPGGNTLYIGGDFGTAWPNSVRWTTATGMIPLNAGAVQTIDCEIPHAFGPVAGTWSVNFRNHYGSGGEIPWSNIIITPIELISGACCLASGACLEVTQAQCTNQGGAYAGDNTLCSTTPCPQPGACCFSDQSCVLLSESQCTTAGGTFSGSGTNCAAGTCWSAPVLWNNGPLATGEFTASGIPAPVGAQWSEVQADNPTFANNSAGASVYIGSFRLADDFTITAPGGWQIDDVLVYCYQTGSSPLATPFTAGYLQIWDGPPGVAGSNVIFGDLTTNRLASSTFTDLYRTFHSTTPPPGTVPTTQRPIYANRLTVNTILPPGTYWIDYSTVVANNPATAHFAPGITPRNVRTAANANARQLTVATGVWAPILDTGFPATPPSIPLDQAFRIHGVALGGLTCYANCDGSTVVPFLNVQDFSCFLSKFAAGDAYANCDGSTIPPVLNVQDFSCFLGKFAAGCSAP